MKLVLKYLIATLLAVGIMSDSIISISDISKIELSENDIEEKEVKNHKYFNDNTLSFDKITAKFCSSINLKHFENYIFLYSLYLHNKIDFPPEMA